MSAPTPNYVHKATYVPESGHQRYDGDTFRLRIDLGTYAGVLFDPIINIRLQGIDVIEYSAPHGRDAAEFTKAKLQSAPLTVATDKPVADTTLGRSVARVWVGDDDLAELLRAAGYEKQKV